MVFKVSVPSPDRSWARIEPVEWPVAAACAFFAQPVKQLAVGRPDGDDHAPSLLELSDQWLWDIMFRPANWSATIRSRAAAKSGSPANRQLLRHPFAYCANKTWNSGESLAVFIYVI